MFGDISAQKWPGNTRVSSHPSGHIAPAGLLCAFSYVVFLIAVRVCLGIVLTPNDQGPYRVIPRSWRRSVCVPVAHIASPRPRSTLTVHGRSGDSNKVGVTVRYSEVGVMCAMRLYGLFCEFSRFPNLESGVLKNICILCDEHLLTNPQLTWLSVDSIIAECYIKQDLTGRDACV